MSVVIDAISNVGKGIEKAVTGVVKAVGNVISSVVNFVASPFMGLFGAPDIPSNDSQSQSITGVLVQKAGTNVNIPVVYGYRKVGGIVTFAETGADNNKYLWVAYALSEGPCEGVREVWINDVQIPSVNIPGLNNGDMVTVTGKDSQGADSKMNGLTALRLVKGTYRNNPAETNVGALVASDIFKGSPSWKETMSYNGVCTLFARFEWKETTDGSNPFGGGIPETKVCLLGKKVAKLTTVEDVTKKPLAVRVINSPETKAWGDYVNGYTEAYSSNPAEILLDYLRNPMYGKGLLNSDIDWESFYVAAVKYNQEIQYTETASGPIITFNNAVDTGQTIFNNVKLILQNCRSYLPYSKGKFTLRVEDAGDPYDIMSGQADIVASFDQDNMHGTVTYTGIDRASKYNQVVVKYVDPDNFWSEQTVTWPETQQERWDFQTIDGGRENKGEFTFAGITNYMMAKDMARLLFNKSRFQDTLSFTASSQAMELEPGDCIYVNSNMMKFGDDPIANAIPWRIVSIKLNNDYTFDIGCVRNPDDIYPHVRAGEIDYKYAAYVPKGASKYYPAEPLGTPNGLAPPWFAPTDGSSPYNPPAAPGVGQLTDSVVLYEAVVESRTNGYYIKCKFLQPSNSAYGGLLVRYKENVASIDTWTSFDVTTKTGSNQPISFEIGPLANYKTYRIETTVKYTSGDYSINKGVTTVAVNYATTTAPPPGTAPTNQITQPTNPADNYLGFWQGIPQTSGGLPLPTRKVDFTLRQDITKGTNSWLIGLEVFYKPSGETGWTRILQPLTNAQGADIKFTLECGPRIYPSVPGSGGVPASVDDYDFIFRFIYTDDKISKYQFRAMNCSVEYGAFGYSSYVLDPAASGGTIYSKELTSSYVPTLATAATITDKRDMTNTMVPYFLEASNVAGVNKLTFWASPPPVAAYPYFLGWRVHRREYILGASLTENPVNSNDLNKPYLSSTDIYFNGTPRTAVGCVFNGLEWDVDYEFIAVPLVWYNNAITTATNCFYWRGKVHNRQSEVAGPNPYPLSAGNVGNWATRYTPVVTDYGTALGSISATYPDTNPVPRNLVVTRTKATTTDRGYFTVKFQVPSSMVSFKVYRRSSLNIKEKDFDTYHYFSEKNLYGCGQWERLTPTYSSTASLTEYTRDANNIVTMNLRPAISGRCEFGYDFDPTQVRDAYNSFFRGYTNIEQSIKSLVGDNKGFGTPTEITQLLVVLNCGTESTNALLVDLNDYTTFNPRTDAIRLDYTTTTSSVSTIINPVPVPAPDVSNLNTMRRTLSEYRARVNDVVIWTNGTQYVAPTGVIPKVR